MADVPTRCIEGTAPWSGAAALATVSTIHGVALTPGEIAAVSHMPGTASHTEGTVLVMARALGYEAVAMEGGYGDLPDVTLPLLVALREGEEERYAVLFAVADEHATVGDPRTGLVSAWPREAFCAVWTGSVVQVTPVEDERRALPAQLAHLRDTLKRTLEALGWGPPYRRRFALLAAWAGLACAAALAPHDSASAAAWTWLIAAACAGSLWSWLVSDLCALCSYARALAGGLPVAAAGSLLYAALVAGSFVPAPAVVTSMAIGAAVGAHGALLRELVKAKVACWACIFVAACAAIAAAVRLLTSGEPWVPLLASAVVMGAGAAMLLPRARSRQERTWRAGAEAIAKGVSAEPWSDGAVRVVAFTRKGCPVCALFHAAVKPALRATFDAAIALEERELGRANVIAPLLVILGRRPSLFIGLPPGDPCGPVLDAVKQAIEAPGESGELIVHQS